MTKLIRLPTKRRTSELPGLAVAGDWDLLPIAVVLWFGSLWRVVSGSLYGEAFHAEATLAFYCVVLIPCWFFWSLIRANARTAPNDPADARDPRRDARVIEFSARRPSRKTG